MESIFCPEAPSHSTAWVSLGAGLEPRCSSCIAVVLSVPGKTGPVCALCKGTENVATRAICQSCCREDQQSNSQEEDQPRRDVTALLFDRRRDLITHLNSAFDGPSKPPVHDPPSTTEQQLRRTEMLLDESRLEVDRLTQENQRLRELGPCTRPHLDPTQWTAIESMLASQGKYEQVARENAALVEQNRALSERLKSAAEHTGGGSGEAFPSPETIASATARKVVDVMPLLVDIKVSDTWLNSKSIESFLNLGQIGIEGPSQALRMRKVTRTCVLIAKLVGRCKAVTAFGKAIKERMINTPEDCLKLVRDLKRIYYKVFKDPASSDLMKELLVKLENAPPAFDGTVAVVAYMSQVLPPKPLTALSLALFRFLERPAEETREWTAALSVVPLKWEDQHREKALAGVQKLMAAVVKMDFHPATLQLLQILNSYKHSDPEPLMIFISRASEALQSEKPSEHVQDLVRKLFAFLRMDVPPEKSRDLNEKAFSALRIYFQGADVTKEQVVLLMCMLLSLQANTFAGLMWLYGDTRTLGNVEFALKLLKQLLIHNHPLERNATVVAAFFTSLSVACASTSITSDEALTFIKATYNLCEAKASKTEEIIETLTSMLNNPVSHFFAKELALLSDINQGKGHVSETNKLLNAVRKNATEVVLPTARYLASMFSQMRNYSITVPILTHDLKVVLIEKTNNLKQLLAALRPIMKAEDIAAQLALRLIELLPKQPDEHVHLLSFIADLANNLSSAPMITNEIAINFCSDAVLPCFFTDNITLLVIMHSQLQTSKLSFLVDLLRKFQRRFTTLDVYELCLLPNLQPEFIRVFDCARLDAKVIQLNQQIRVDTSSSYAFIDEGKIISCGGIFHSGSDCSGSRVGAGASSRAFAVRHRQDTYMLACNGAVETLPNMRDPRSYHGILFHAKSRNLFVFGGSQPPDTMKSCEMMKVEEKTWRPVPDMKEARYCFNPCLYNGIVYLCGYGTVNIETFNPETLEFVLPSPSPTLPESHFCCTVEHDGHLLVVSYSYITRYKLEGSTLVKVDERREQVSRTVWQNSNPRVLGNNVFFSENNTWCWINVKEGGRLKLKS